MTSEIIAVADAVRAERYGGSAAFFLAGSLVRGEGTPYSDLDLVVVYPALPSAYRESFRFGGCPVEAFVHEPETLEYFFVEIDRASGVPSLPQMVAEGLELPEPNALSRALKQRAAAVLEMGPPVLDIETERRLRYMVTDFMNDLRGCTSREEMDAVGSQLFEALANYYLRSRRLWAARGKTIPKALRNADAAFGSEYCRAFETLFRDADAAAVVRLTEDVLRAAGGPLFDGYRSDAPKEWRIMSGPQRATQKER